MKSPEERLAEFKRYAQPIYKIEFQNGDNLFPFVVNYYHETEKEVVRIFENSKDALRVVKKDFTTGREKVIKEKK